MNSRCGLILLSIFLGCAVPTTTQANPTFYLAQNSTPCPQPALSRLIRHKVAPGETLESIAQQYNLIPATLIGMNPALQNGNKLAVGSEILVTENGEK